MPTNKYVTNYSKVRTSEQLLYEDLIVESIKMYGYDVMYLPRENWDDTDMLYGENIASRFEKAYPIEMYITDVTGLSGDKDFFSRFGVEIRDNGMFVVARRTFARYVPNNVTIRPREGDLLWVPVMNRIFEIKFIEEESIFIALGNAQPYTYELRCELFRYSNEIVNTGIEEIDGAIDDASYTIEVHVSGIGNFRIGETVFQGNSLSYATMTGKVHDWSPSNNLLYLIHTNGNLDSANTIHGETSNVTYSIVTTDTLGDHVYYDTFDNQLIQNEANNFINLDEINPFGMP